MSLNRPASLQHTDHSGSLTTGGTSQQLMAANALRIGFRFQNISTEDMWINVTGGAAAANTAGSYKVATGNIFEYQQFAPLGQINIVGATSGDKYSCTEWGS